MRKIEVHKDTLQNLSWGHREREDEAQKQREETTHSAEEGVAAKHARTARRDTEMDTEAGEEALTSKSHSKQKNGHMANIYLTDSDEEAIVDHKELYDKTIEQGQSKEGFFQGRFAEVASCLSRCAGPRLSCKGHAMASSHNLSLVWLQNI